MRKKNFWKISLPYCKILFDKKILANKWTWELKMTTYFSDNILQTFKHEFHLKIFFALNFSIGILNL